MFPLRLANKALWSQKSKSIGYARRFVVNDDIRKQLWSVALGTPPRLKLVDQPALIKFETEYAAYEDRVDDVNKNRTEEIHTATIKDCINPATLYALCEISEIPNAKKLEDAMSDRFKSWFDTEAKMCVLCGSMPCLFRSTSSIYALLLLLNSVIVGECKLLNLGE